MAQFPGVERLDRDAASGGSPQSRAKILVVDDEEAIRRLLKQVLKRRNYEVLLAANGYEALDKAAEFAPGLVILDLALPGMGGLEVCRELRAWLTAPILVLSGREEESTKISALDNGADDYVTKPFAVGELLARIRALLRRSSSQTFSPTVFSSGELTVDMARRRVFSGGQEIRLTRTEFDILATLARHAGCVVTSATLLDEVLGDDYGDRQTLRVHVGHLRKKSRAGAIQPPIHPHRTRDRLLAFHVHDFQLPLIYTKNLCQRRAPLRVLHTHSDKLYRH